MSHRRGLEPLSRGLSRRGFRQALARRWRLAARSSVRTAAVRCRESRFASAAGNRSAPGRRRRRGMPPRRMRSGFTPGLSPRSSRTSRGQTCAHSGSRCSGPRRSWSCSACCISSRWRSLRPPWRCRSEFLLYLLRRRRLRGRADHRGRVHGRVGDRRRSRARLCGEARSRATRRSSRAARAPTTSSSGSGVILPCAGLALMVAGPLVLLPYRKFNDLLDGVTVGACCGATLVAAEAITNSASFLHLGFKPGGNAELWIARLLTLGVATPVLAAGAAGAVAGSFWLRFRCPVPDRSALGSVGSPFASVPLAAGSVCRRRDRSPLPQPLGNYSRSRRRSRWPPSSGCA